MFNFIGRSQNTDFIRGHEQVSHTHALLIRNSSRDLIGKTMDHVVGSIRLICHCGMYKILTVILMILYCFQVPTSMPLRGAAHQSNKPYTPSVENSDFMEVKCKSRKLLNETPPMDDIVYFCESLSSGRFSMHLPK